MCFTENEQGQCSEIITLSRKKHLKGYTIKKIIPTIVLRTNRRRRLKSKVYNFLEKENIRTTVATIIIIIAELLRAHIKLMKAVACAKVNLM